MKRRGMALLLAAVIMLLSACGGAPDEDTNLDTSPTEPEDNGWADYVDTSVTLQETEILSGVSSDIRVVATGLEYSRAIGVRVKLTVENRRERDIRLAIDNGEINNMANLNGVMVWTYIHNEMIPDGQTVEASIMFDMSVLKELGIRKIASLHFPLRVYFADTGEFNLETDGILSTSAYADYEPEYTPQGTTVYEKDWLKVVDTGFTEDGYQFAVCNDSGRYLKVEMFDVLVNGMEYSDGSFYIYKNAIYIKELLFLGEVSGLGDVDTPEKVTSLTYKLRISKVLNYEGEFETVWESGTIIAR